MKFYICKTCGNIVEMVQDSGVVPMCCGKSMTELAPNTTEAAGEKHLPVITKNGADVHVAVGAAAHPMSQEHSIQWIAVKTKAGCQRKHLSPENAPETDFALAPGDTLESAFAYCNLHGLWKTEA